MLSDSPNNEAPQDYHRYSALSSKLGKKRARMRKGKFRAGKIEPSFLEGLLAKNRIADPRVLVGPGVGLDAAVITFGKENLLVAKTDPITFATDEIGWYAVQVNANDIATAGARPRWFLATLLLPERQTTRALVERIYADIRKACKELEIELVGGHTEITCGLDRPIVIGQMLGEVVPEKLIRADGARSGDTILLTKRAAVEGTAILGREFSEKLTAQLGDTFARRCRNFLHNPGISVLRDALIACEVAGAVHAMHDPTEGGLITGLHELAHASGCGLRVRRDQIPLYPETIRACEVFELDPLGLIASGSLLIVADPAQSQKIIDRLNAASIECTAIGEMLEHGARSWLIRSDGEQELLKPFERDEIARLFSE